MKLADWRNAQGWTQQRLADELGCSLVAVARYETAARLPERDMLKRIYVLTKRAVCPNDFHDIASWEAELIAAEGDVELARQAA